MFVHDKFMSRLIINHESAGILTGSKTDREKKRRSIERQKKKVRYENGEIGSLPVVCLLLFLTARCVVSFCSAFDLHSPC